jgi:dTDP-4-amino-4,6-dideoxygalactose transaminase
VDTPASRATRWLIPRVADPAVAERRRANYRVLLEELPDLVAAPFRTLPEGACPLVFPVDVPAPAFVERLDRFGVAGGPLWPNPHPSLPVDRFPEAARLRERLVGLPVHHELSRAALDRIVDAASD